jgi:hypothetical protein
MLKSDRIGSFFYRFNSVSKGNQEVPGESLPMGHSKLWALASPTPHSDTRHHGYKALT